MAEGNGKLEIDTHLETLRATHRALDDRIAQLIADGNGDPLTIARLKKQKLTLKDRIAYLQNERLPDIIA